MMTSTDSTTIPTFSTTEYPEPTVVFQGGGYAEVRLAHLSATARTTPASVAAAILDLQTRFEMEEATH